MLNKNERMNKLNNAGVNTGKYFTLDLPEGIPAGGKIHVVIDENGVAVPMVLNENNNDPILNQIIEDGYVRNTKLHRRFVMAQMFQMLNYVSYDGRDKGYNSCLRRMYDYKYTIKMMLEEVKVLSKLEAKDKETFAERAHFFDRVTIAAVLDDYIDELKNYVDKLHVHKCKGVPYKKIKGMNIFIADFDKKLYFPIKSYISQIRCAQDYNKIYHVLCEFSKNMVKLPYNTKKSAAWVDAYKGEGAFYTLKNLVMFHNCGIKVDKFDVKYGAAAVHYLNGKLDEYKGEGWRMFALMKKVISDNNFDFKKRMEEIYKK